MMTIDERQEIINLVDEFEDNHEELMHRLGIEERRKYVTNLCNEIRRALLEQEIQ